MLSCSTKSFKTVIREVNPLVKLRVYYCTECMSIRVEKIVRNKTISNSRWIRSASS